MKSTVENRTDALAFLINEPGNPKNLSEINALLRATIEREPAIHEAMVLSTEANIIALIEPDMNILGDKPLSYEELQPITANNNIVNNAESPEIIIPSSGRIYIGSPKKDINLHESHNEKNKYTFTLAAPIGNPAKAILVIFVDIKKLWATHEEDNTHGIGLEKTRDYILDRRGALLTDINNTQFKAGDLMTHFAITRTALFNKQWQADTPYIGVTDEPVFGTLTKIPSLNWSLVSEVIISEITQPIWISLLKIMSATLFGVAVFLWFVLSLVNKTLKPIQQASDAIDLVAKGNYEVSLEPTGIRELDAMTSGINRMTMARKCVEHELINKEKEQRQMLNSMVDAVISIDEDGIILSFNTAAEELFGYSANDATEININQLMPEPYSSHHTGYLQHYLKTGEARVIGFSRDVEGLHKNKKTFPLRLLVAELPVSSNGKRRFIGSCVDLTQVKQQEEQLRRSQKMDALGKLTGGIAHDYNNMLGVIMGYASLLKQALKDNEKLLAYSDEIHRAGERGASLTKKLLNFSSNKRGHNKSVNINTILQDENDMLDKILTARIKLTLNLSDDLWKTYLDENDLINAVLNMSINAMHAIKENGQLTIETKNEQLDEFDIQALDLSAGDYISLSIADTGSGIKESIRENIFEPFYTTKGVDGTGLGLSQVYGFVKRCGGDIKVISKSGHGTQFILYFPRHHSNNNDEQITTSKSIGNVGGNETILLVDDEVSLLKLNSDILKEHGYKTLCADNAQHALQLLERKNIDLMLSDIIMPEMDGYQLASMVGDKYPDIKIQLASGFSDHSNSKLVDETLRKNILSKPFSSQQLLEKIRTLLDS
ncbi:MAG: PAS domain S-box protein [Sulfuriflexus sp.]|nr:PAS domain S-box protein [Sulfuriflexus sp.]